MHFNNCDGVCDLRRVWNSLCSPCPRRAQEKSLMIHGISLSLIVALGLLVASPLPVLSAGLNHEEMVYVGNDVELPAGDTATEVVVIGGDVKIAGNVEREVVVVGGD